MTDIKTGYKLHQIVSLGCTSVGIAFLRRYFDKYMLMKGSFVMVKNTAVLLAAMLNDRKGISALEYAVLAAGILGVLATAVGLVGGQITKIFGSIVTDLGG